MQFRGQIYNTLADWKSANNLAHNTLNSLDKYTSKDYANPIETTDNKFILVELKGFETQLKAAGFNFVSLEKTIIKINKLE